MTKARAKIAVTVEVEAASTWGDRTTLTQVYDQGAVEAVGRLRKALDGLAGVRIVRDSIRVSAVIVEREPGEVD